MRKTYCIIIFSLTFAGAFAQNVASINGKPVGSKEFMWVYKKNHSGVANAAFKELEDYLNLYLNFKLKVLDAIEMGFDKDTAYLTEIKNYEAALRTRKKISNTKATYSMVLNEYKNAVLMFNISELKVWDKAQNDEDQLRSFYERNKLFYKDGSFEELKGKIINDYQDVLEREWVVALRKKYPVKVYEAELRKLAKL
ncbi:hypothetical protein SAMN05421820_11217 [Pedobacter steynii]|uniref:Uncharacterized protein n=1 Tax=Pedobacter steynii TaxID=430522 RepID=A0A1H0H4F3_9SPHI|nr:hypothetical protein [Pedobacter steynii]NQX42739.1 hypothetical protein [Pedobacter steynii]SDO13791.1 hypothetical protein SAMN05421820_11217 [Pedobacter steynii]